MTTKHFFLIAAVFSFSISLAQGKFVTYEVDNEPYEGYYIKPSTENPGNAALVLILHDWDGLTDYEVKRANMLAEEGYQVFAADLFGKGIRPTENKEKAQHTGELYKDRSKLRRLMTGALHAARQQGAETEKVASMGYCFGGAAALELARSETELKGFATFHGGLGTPEGQDYSKTRGKIIIFHGTADSAITMDDSAGLAKELEAAKIPHEMISYGNAPHGFTVFGTPAYRPETDKQSWKRFLKFLEEIFS